MVWLFSKLYLRTTTVGRAHIPRKGPLIVACNHRSFLDPFIVGIRLRRPVYFMAKRELFRSRLTGWLLNCMGAFPVDRGTGDTEAMETARALLDRGEALFIFPEGTRIRPGALGRPRRGVGRLALRSGAPVVPAAVIGTEDVRRGWRLRPRHVRIRFGRPLTFPRVEDPSPALATAVTERIWPCVNLQWEWLGGLPPLRRATVIGGGAWGTAMAVLLARAGLDVQLGCRSREQAERMREARVNETYLSGVELPDGGSVRRASELELCGQDLVCFAVPSAALPAALAAHGSQVPQRAGVLLLAKGLVPPLGALPVDYVAERVRARAVAMLGGPAHAAECLRSGASLVLAGRDRAFQRQLHDLLSGAGFSAQRTDDVLGVQLAGTAKNAAVLAAAAAGPAGPNVAGAAAGNVFGEIAAYARARGARPETFLGLAGAGDLVGTVVAQDSRNRRAGALLGQGVPAGEIGPALGHAVEAVDTLPLLATRLREAGADAVAVRALADLVEGRLPAERWIRSVTAPRRERPRGREPGRRERAA